MSLELMLTIGLQLERASVSRSTTKVSAEVETGSDKESEEEGEKLVNKKKKEVMKNNFMMKYFQVKNKETSAFPEMRSNDLDPNNTYIWKCSIKIDNFQRSPIIGVKIFASTLVPLMGMRIRSPIVGK